MSTSARSPASAKRGAPAYRCSECGWASLKWVGRCGECQAWGTVTQVDDIGAGTQASTPRTAAVPIEQVSLKAAQCVSTGVAEFDRVLGGGVVPGGVMLIAGEPGIGKSTLALDVAARAARSGSRVLYISGEESAAQVRLRAERIGALAAQLFLAAETDLASILGHIERVQPTLLIVDSVQTIASADVDGAAGNVGQVKEVASALIKVAKSTTTSTLLVGHVTKDGSIAGPRVLEHVVDVVVQFEGERHSRLRLVRAVKNRFGPTDEVGCFDLGDTGITGLPDPSGLFLTSRDVAVAGTCVTVTLQGRRPMVTEVQALVHQCAGGSPRRTTSGIDSSRLAMVLAVLSARAGLDFSGADCYCSTVGGARLSEPSADLAVALALAGASVDRALPLGTVAFGEVGLAGELRPVTGAPRRLAEAARIGFRRAVVPAGSMTEGPSPDGMRVTQAATVAQAAAAAFGDTEAPEEPRGRPPSAIDSGHDKIGTRPGIETRSGAGAT
ncbi:MAG: DNA repair protein RadA [Ornithinimicrobium sp.]